MITKEMYCKQILQDFAYDERIPIDQIDDNYIYSSSTLAVAMEFLNLLKSKQAKEYTATRGGIFFTCVDENKKEVNILSTREFINLLPDKI